MFWLRGWDEGSDVFFDRKVLGGEVVDVDECERL